MVQCYEDGFFLSRHEVMLIYCAIYGKKYGFENSLYPENVDQIFKEFDPSLVQDPTYVYPGSIRLELENGKHISVPVHRWTYYKYTMPSDSSVDSIIERMKQRSREGYIVHHIDGNTKNNHITNLYEVNNKQHKRLEDCGMSGRVKLMIETLKIVQEANQMKGK